MTALLHAIAPYAVVAVLMWTVICFCVIVIVIYRRYIKPIFTPVKTRPFVHYGGNDK